MSFFKKKVDWSKVEEGVRVVAKYKGEERGGVYLMNPGGADKSVLHINLDDDDAKYRKIKAKDVRIDDAPVTKPATQVKSVEPLKAIVPDRPDPEPKVGSSVWVNFDYATRPGVVVDIRKKRHFIVDVEGDSYCNRCFSRDEIVRVLS